MVDLASLIESGAEELAKAGIREPRREASALLEAAIGRDRTFLVAHPEYRPLELERSRFQGFVERRTRREPFHYITGTKEFFGLDFRVSPAVLIPRPETEMLVEQGIGFLRDFERPRFCEVGVGSGCISVALLVNLPNAIGVGLEISPEAIEVAVENAARQEVDDRFDLRRSDLFDSLKAGEKFDLIVSNPPYIPIGDLDGLEPDVRDFEPHIALTDKADGLSIVEKIADFSPSFLVGGGRVLIEFGYGQAEKVSKIFERGWKNADIKDDFQGIPRTISASWPN